MLKPIPSGTGLSFQQIGNFAYRRTYLYKFTNNQSVFSIRQAGLLSYTIFEDCHCATFPTPDYRNIVLQGDEKSVFYRIIVLQDDEKCTFLLRAIQFAELCSANYVRKERARMRNLAGSYPGPYLRLSPAVVSNARRGTIGL